MKKKVLMIMVLLIVVGASGIFAQSQAKYYMEVWTISQATLNAILNDKNSMREDDYFLARTARGSSSRSKEKNLTLDQVRQKLTSLSPGATGLDEVISQVQRTWGAGGTLEYTKGNLYVYVWIRRTE